jgi:hypothetical protein
MALGRAWVGLPDPVLRWQARLVCGTIGLVTLIYLVQNGDRERLAGDAGLTELGRVGVI